MGILQGWRLCTWSTREQKELGKKYKKKEEEIRRRLILEGKLKFKTPPNQT